MKNDLEFSCSLGNFIILPIKFFSTFLVSHHQQSSSSSLGPTFKSKLNCYSLTCLSRLQPISFLPELDIKYRVQVQSSTSTPTSTTIYTRSTEPQARQFTIARLYLSILLHSLPTRTSATTKQ